MDATVWCKLRHVDQKKVVVAIGYSSYHSPLCRFQITSQVPWNGTSLSLKAQLHRSIYDNKKMPWKSKLTMCKKEFLSRNIRSFNDTKNGGLSFWKIWLHYSEDSRFRQIQNLQKPEATKSSNQVVRKFHLNSSGKKVVAFIGTALARNRTIATIARNTWFFGASTRVKLQEASSRRMKLKAVNLGQPGDLSGSESHEAAVEVPSWQAAGQEEKTTHLLGRWFRNPKANHLGCR